MREPSRQQVPGILATWKQWPRFKRYELKESGRPSPAGGNHLYVSPVKGEDLEFYDPFECFPKILLDYLELAASIYWLEGEAREDHTRRKASRILQFCNNYGLPGQFWFYIKWCDPINGRLFVDPGWASPFFPSGQIHYDEYAEYFFPDQPVPDFWLGASSFPNYPLTKRDEGFADQKHFFESYCEPVDGFAVHAYDLKTKAILLEDYQQGNQDVGDPTEVDEEFEVEPVGLRLLFDGSWRIEWAYRSLLDALSIMFILNATTQVPKVKVCVECQQPYIAIRPTARYCSESHGARYRKRRQRERTKKEKNKGT